MMKKFLFSVLFLSCYLATALPAAELETIKNATLIRGRPRTTGTVSRSMPTARNCTCGSTTWIAWKPPPAPTPNWRRIREGNNTISASKIPAAVVRFGKQATEYVKRVLARPFHHSYRVTPSHRGRSATGRYYAFIETHDGRDLGHLLVEQGLARIHGKTRPAPRRHAERNRARGTPGHALGLRC